MASENYLTALAQCAFCTALCAQISERAHVSLVHSLLLERADVTINSCESQLRKLSVYGSVWACVCQLMEAGGLGSKLSMLLFVLYFLLKGPKHENFGSEFLTPSKTIWMGDLRTGTSKINFSKLGRSLMSYGRKTYYVHSQQELNVSSACSYWF